MTFFITRNCANVRIPTETMPWSGNSPPHAKKILLFESQYLRKHAFLNGCKHPKSTNFGENPDFSGGLLNSGLLADLESAPKRKEDPADHNSESLPP